MLVVGVFSWQSQSLFVGGMGFLGPHGSLRCWLWVETGFSWQAHRLVVGGLCGGCHGSPRHWLYMGEAGVLMAVPIPFGMGDGIQGYSWQPQTLVVGVERRGFKWQY